MLFTNSSQSSDIRRPLHPQPNVYLQWGNTVLFFCSVKLISRAFWLVKNENFQVIMILHLFRGICNLCFLTEFHIEGKEILISMFGNLMFRVKMQE